MKYADIKGNDIVDGKGICVSFWCQGCPFHCLGCHNPQTWDFNGGIEDTQENILNKIKNAIESNNIKRNLSILGGEPLCDENISFISILINWFKKEYPNRKIYLWTGYYFNELTQTQKQIATLADVIIDGRFVLERRDISLELRGSSNQHILTKGKDY